MNVNSKAIDQFLKERSENNRSSVLIKKKGQIHISDKKDLSRWVRFKAKIGCGEASFCKVSSFINGHQNAIFVSDNGADERIKKEFNLFVDHYNSEKRVFWKTAKKISNVRSSISVTGSEKSTESQVSNTVQDSQAYLTKISDEYRNWYQVEKPLVWLSFFTKLKSEFTTGARVRPDDHIFSNLILKCQEDDEAYFIPTNSFEDPNPLFGYTLNPTELAELEFLKATLRAAFATKKKIVVVRLGGNGHTVAAGFAANGDFKIIDSMVNGTINIKTLTQHLNQAGIKNEKGNSIQFKGEYVNTRLQKVGHECIRFATLYCYWMYKQKSLEAFEEVNGAFIEGKLQTFEDYTKIEGSSRVRTIKGGDNSSYTNFMRSWAYRTQGLKIDTWEGISTEMLQEGMMQGRMRFYCLHKDLNPFPKWAGIYSAIIVDSEGNERSIKDLPSMPKEQEIPIAEGNDTLGSLAVSGEKRLLVFEEKNPEPQLYRLLPGQKLYNEDWNGKRSIINF